MFRPGFEQEPVKILTINLTPILLKQDNGPLWTCLLVVLEQL